MKMCRAKENFRISNFCIVIIIFAILKQLLVANLPLLAIPVDKYDDGWMMKLGYFIANNSWLGSFDEITLMKELTGPIYLGLCSKLGLSFIGTTTFLYSVGCMIFVYSIKSLFKKEWYLLAIYLVLLFNPVSYASWTLQRVYRCGLTMIEVLMLFGSYFALYLKRDKGNKKLIFWSIIAGIVLAATYHTREDRIWILPFVIIVTIILIVNTIINSKINNFSLKNINFFRIILIIFPVIILLFSNISISYLNYKYYGIYSYNLIDDSNFSRVVSCFYRIKTPDDDEQYRISVPITKLDLLCEISPTLRSIEDKLKDQWKAWGQARLGMDENENGMIIWPLISAVADYGYYKDGKTVDEFYKKVADEIEIAIENGEVESRLSMPSPLMPPWRTEYGYSLLKTMCKFTIDSVKFTDVKAVCESGRGDNIEDIRFAEAITNDMAIKNDNDYAIKCKKKLVDRVNKITPIYSYIFPILSMLGILSYILLSFKVIINLKNKINNKKEFDTWLILTSLLLSYIVLIGGVSYNEIASVKSSYYMYRSGGYPLIIMFVMLANTFMLNNFKLKDN